MCLIISFFMLLLVYTLKSNCERRITGGNSLNVNAPFVVYLVAAPTAEHQYPGWMCAGAIVDRWFVMTSAACLEDVSLAYVIAGYHTYVPGDAIEADECTHIMKKRIVSYCYQEQYTTSNSSGRKWAEADIALAKVHEPFDFKDPKYLVHCSYLPEKIAVGFNYQQRRDGMGVLVYGWGHKKYFRPPGDENDYNSPTLTYASSRLISREECMKSYPKDMQTNIKKYCVCTAGRGYLDDVGRLTNLQNTAVLNCLNATCRRNLMETRRQGLCQNDHGAPLVTFWGGRMYAIGVATAFLLSHEMSCIGPFVYTSTACAVKFMKCMLSHTRRFSDCARTEKIQIVEKNFDWTSRQGQTRPPKSTKTATTTKIGRSNPIRVTNETLNTDKESYLDSSDDQKDQKKRSSTEELLELYD